MNLEFQSALLFTLKQALLSSVFSVLLALIASPGYHRLGIMKRPTRSLLLFPQLVSPVLIVLSLLLFFNSFPFGLSGVVIGHVFMNAGLGIIFLGEAWESIERDWKKLSVFLGAKNLFYFKKVALPLILPQIKTFFALVFSFSLASLLIPLVLGGGPQATTLEVLIYEKLKVSGEIKSAMLIALLQFLLQLLFFIIFLKALKIKTAKTKNIYSRFNFNWAGLLTLSISIFLFIPFIKIIEVALLKPFDHFFKTAFLIAGMNSFITAFAVGTLAFIGTAIWNTWGSKDIVTKIPSVSHVILGLIGILILGVSSIENIFVMFLSLVVGHTLSFFLPLLRFAHEPLTRLFLKFSPALKNMGVSKTLSFKKVYFPLGRKIYFFIFLVAFSWSLGEFTISSLLAPSQATLPLYIQSFMGQYRLEEAAQASLLLFAVGFLTSILGESFFHGRT